MSDSTMSDAAKSKAEASFKREQLLGSVDANRQADKAAKTAEIEKTARLRALRLAKEQADQTVAAAPKPERKR